MAVMNDAALNDFYAELSLLHYLPRHAHIVALLGYVVDKPSRSDLMVLGQSSKSTTEGGSLRQPRGQFEQAHSLLFSPRLLFLFSVLSFVSSEWMDQGSLYDFLRRVEADPARFPLLSRLRVCLQCASSVNHLHLLRPPRGPIVHRDIKSLNFLMDKFGEVKLGDFGLAKVRVASSTASTFAGAVGTLRWSAPEFLRAGGKKSATPASDIYALGVVLWEILTLQIPYDGDDDDTIHRSIKGGPDDKLAIPDDCSANVKSLLHACWNNDPTKRPTAMHLMQAFKQIIAEEESRCNTAPVAVQLLPTSPSPSPVTLDVLAPSVASASVQVSSASVETPSPQRSSGVSSDAAASMAALSVSSAAVEASISALLAEDSEFASFVRSLGDTALSGSLVPPHGVCVSGDRVFVTDQMNGRVLVFTKDGQFQLQLSIQGFDAAMTGWSGRWGCVRARSVRC